MDEAFSFVGAIIGIALLVVGVRWLDYQLFQTTYCTDWVKVVKIEPTFEDNGKHEDEQYIITYEDGTTAGSAQGSVEPYRCTNEVTVKDGKENPNWKKDNWGYTW